MSLNIAFYLVIMDIRKYITLVWLFRSGNLLFLEQMNANGGKNRFGYMQMETMLPSGIYFYPLGHHVFSFILMP